jgi:hypothetical protein
MKKLTQDEFIKRASRLYSTAHNYEKVKYVNSCTKVTIICKVHGEFLKTPNDYLQGHGCPRCKTKKIISTKSFVEEATVKYGDLYDYSESTYVNSTTKIRIICREHGAFFITANQFFKAKVCCPECRRLLKIKTRETFIKEAQEKFGNKFIYDRVNYTGNNKKVIIECSIHGLFERKPNDFLHSLYGCPYCGRESTRISTEEFIERSKEKHGNKFDYSRVILGKNINDKVEIICPKHGSFFQAALEHMRGSGCCACGSDSLRVSREDFLKRAMETHHNKYSYILDNYSRAEDKITIVCPIHGEFKLKATRHLCGTGCKKCAADSKKVPIEEFIERARKLHGNRYNYSLVKYEYTFEKVKIICPKHGIFEQRGTNHLTGNRCPYCRESRGEEKIAEYLIKNNVIFKRQHRIKECRNKKPLPFDFAVFEDEEKTKLKCLIEFDGAQHFRVCPNYKMEERDLAKIQYHDSIKNLYCEKENIPLLRISYKEYNQIETILKDKLQL